jgi:hypothetical protein
LHDEDVQSTWEGVAPWDPRGKPAGEEIVEGQGPVEAMDIAMGIVAHNKRHLPHPIKSEVAPLS